MRRLLVVLLFAALVLSPSARARAPEAEGQAPFRFSAWFGDPPRVGKQIRLWFSMAGMQFDTAATGVAHITLPPGLKLVSGDTLHVGQPAGRNDHWRLVVVPQLAGDYEITGTLRITSDKGRLDEADLVFRCHIEADTAAVEDSRVTRLETVRHGQRYRYGGRYLVPIEAPEHVTQAEIERSGTRAAIRASSPGRCVNCGTKGTVEARFVVFVNATGSVVGARPLQALPPAVERAARDVLEGWKFEPTRVHGHPVSDWLRVTVRIDTDS